MKTNKLNKAKLALIDLVNEFVNDYYKDYDGDYFEPESKQDTFERFACGEVQGIFELSDMFLTINDVFNFYGFDCDFDTFRDWYWDSVENRKQINLRNYICQKKESKEKK